MRGEEKRDAPGGVDRRSSGRGSPRPCGSRDSPSARRRKPPTGQLARARAIATRWRWPPDSRSGRTPNFSDSPTDESSSRAFALRAAASRPASAIGYATFSSAVSTGIRLNVWKTKPKRSRRRSDRSSSERACPSRPSTRTVPPSGRSRRPSRLRSVVLPEPLGPRSATNSPGAIASDTPRTAGTSDSPSRYERERPAASTRAPEDAEFTRPSLA